jgi:hypothetical protein
MSDFGVYENLEWGSDSVAARTAAHRKAVATAIHMAKREFGAYLGNARSPQEWDDRLSQVIGDMSYLVEKHASFTDLDKVVTALRTEAEGRHFAPGGVDGWVQNNDGGYSFGDPGLYDEFGYLDMANGKPSGGGYFPMGDAEWDEEGSPDEIPAANLDGLNLDQAQAEIEKLVPQYGPDGRHRANKTAGHPFVPGSEDDIDNGYSEDPGIAHLQRLHDDDPYYDEDLANEFPGGEFPGDRDVYYPTRREDDFGPDNADPRYSDPNSPEYGIPGYGVEASRKTADEGIEDFNDQELLDDWPLQENPVDEAFDGDENDLETSNAPLSTGGSEGEQPDLTLTASSLPMVPRIATPTFPVPNGNQAPAQAPVPELQDPNQQRPITPGAVDTLNQNPVPQRPTMAGRNLPFPVVPRVAPKG